MSTLLNLINEFNAIPIKILANYFVDTDKLILQFMWRGKRSRTANSIQKENKIRGLTPPNFKTCDKAISNQDSLILLKEQTNRAMKINRLAQILSTDL